MRSYLYSESIALSSKKTTKRNISVETNLKMDEKTIK